jgi:arylsulfatase A
VQLEFSLFDLDNDIGETTNVADKHPEIVERLSNLATSMRDDLGDSLTKKEGKGVRPAGMVEEKK